MFESKDSTLGIYNRVDVNQLGYCNAFIRKCYLRDINGFILTKCELVSYCTPVVAITYNLDGTPIKPNYCNGLRLINLQTGLIKGYDDTYNMFMVKYDSIKPFNQLY